MCFGSSDKDKDLRGPPVRMASTRSRTPPKYSDITQGFKEQTENIKEPSSHSEYGESMGLDIHARNQKRIRQAYPDGKVPEDMKKFHETGMAQGAIGGPMGGGAGLALSGGI